MPDSASYDDLLYKLLGEAASSSKSNEKDIFTILRTQFAIASRPDADASVDLMVGLIQHYRSILDDPTVKKSKNLSPKEVSRIIKQGYETMDLQIKEGWGVYSKFREVDRKGLLKSASRFAVADVKRD